jgi:cytochrome c oxidase subunit 2
MLGRPSRRTPGAAIVPPVLARRALVRFVAGAAVALLVLAGCGGGGGGEAGTPTPGAGPAARGKVLYSSKGCDSCHSLDGSGGVGPTWKGLASSRVTLTGGKTVTADAAYLRAAIEDPDKQIVAGYKAGVMTATVPRGSISPADAKALVAYIESLK